jgi:hypothetical protein
MFGPAPRIAAFALALAAVVATQADCGGTELELDSPDAGGAEAASGYDATREATLDTGIAAMPCVPGQSVACVGSGGCSSNQVCNATGSGFGPCDCMQTEASTAPPCVPGQSVACVGSGGCSSNQLCNAAGTGYGPCVCAPVEAGSPCVPGQSVACIGPGGCLSDQVCNMAGTGYGACTCPDSDGAILVCIPGQSIACTGQGGCFANQVCNGDGTAYGPCVCSDGGSVECETANDCTILLGPPPSGFCITCPNGSIGCGHYECVSGICQTTYCG